MIRIFICIYLLLININLVNGKSHYDTLNIRQSASESQIRKSYRNLAKKYHPDKNNDPSAQDKFLEVTKAYEVLSDEKLRREYDDELKYGRKENLQSPHNQYHQSQHFQFHSPHQQFRRSQNTQQFHFHFGNIPNQQRRREFHDPRDEFEQFFQFHQRQQEVSNWEVLLQLVIALLGPFAMPLLMLSLWCCLSCLSGSNRRAELESNKVVRYEEINILTWKFIQDSSFVVISLSSGFDEMIKEFPKKTKYHRSNVNFAMHQPHCNNNDNHVDLILLSQDTKYWCGFDKMLTSTTITDEDIEIWIRDSLKRRNLWKSVATNDFPIDKSSIPKSYELDFLSRHDLLNYDMVIVCLSSDIHVIDICKRLRLQFFRDNIRFVLSMASNKSNDSLICLYDHGAYWANLDSTRTRSRSNENLYDNAKDWIMNILLNRIHWTSIFEPNENNQTIPINISLFR